MIEGELAEHDPRLAELPRILALSKADLVPDEDADAAAAEWRERLGVPVVDHVLGHRPGPRRAARASCCAASRSPSRSRRPRARTRSPSSRCSARRARRAFEVERTGDARVPRHRRGGRPADRAPRPRQRGGARARRAPAAPDGRDLRAGGKRVRTGRRRRARRRGVRARSLPRLSSVMPVAVVKLGSSIVAEDSGELRLSVVARICEEVAALHREGVDVVVVTSGAIARGMHLLELGARPAAVAGPAGGQRGRAGAAVPDLRRAAARARDPDRPGAAHVLRRERPHALPERAPHAAQAARVADRAGDQRERHDDHRRDLVRRQRLPRRAGGGAAWAPTCSSC